MKLTIIGLVFMLAAVLFAGNWVYNPFASPQFDDPFEPLCEFPEGDEPDEIYRSDMIYIPNEDIYYMEWSYVWLNASDHTPDTERVRVFINNGTLHHIELEVHYKWLEITEEDYSVDGNHVIVKFLPVYHTPYVSMESLTSTSITRILPFAIPFTFGAFLIVVDYKLASFSARAKIARGFEKYSWRAKFRMIFGKNKPKE